uniref:tRNA(Phe) (4-demethylwyosine(37)-C(7)) aminocarboxypropyltransferase n=1 Tax=Caenorhabditis japonica TaxID=281687 RepID=A0A8R1E0W7_CAEJA
MERTSSLRRKSTDGGVLAKASNFGQMLEDVRKLALSKSLWDDEMQRDLPKKWEKHGDMIVFPQNTFSHINWRYIGRELWAIVAQSLNVARVGRKRQIDEMRTAHVDLLYGADGWVDYVDERGVRFAYDTTKRVFDNAKKAEMKRISKWACQGQTVVDMYASLGYYSLTFLVCCEAKQVVAIDWNDEILESLVRSSQVNHVDDRLLVIHGDCRRVCPDQTADRVYLGLMPSCRAHWLAACKALKAEGGIIHINEILDMNAKAKSKTPVVEKKAEEKPKEAPKKKKVLRQKTMPVLSAVNEHPVATSSDAPQSASPHPTEGQEVPSEENGEKKKKKFTRSASIVEEMENRVLPDVRIWKDYENEGWSRLSDKHREFAKDCGQSCTRFLNNIHLSDEMYAVTVVNMTRYGEVSKGKEHVVLELLCCQQDASAEHLIAKFTAENLKS